MRVGYARTSTTDQKLDLQIDALKAAGCAEDKIFTDTISGAKSERPGLARALEYLREGDTLIVWKLDRLGRSLKHLVNTVDELRNRGIGFVSLQENLDTTTPGGKLIFHVFCAISEFEREIIQERVNAGLTAARARGRFGGRPRKLTPKQIQIGKSLAADPKNTVTDICKTLGISRDIYYRHIHNDSQV